MLQGTHQCRKQGAVTTRTTGGCLHALLRCSKRAGDCWMVPASAVTAEAGCAEVQADCQLCHLAPAAGLSPMRACCPHPDCKRGSGRGHPTAQNNSAPTQHISSQLDAEQQTTAYCLLLQLRILLHGLCPGLDLHGACRQQRCCLQAPAAVQEAVSTAEAQRTRELLPEVVGTFLISNSAASMSCSSLCSS